MPFWRTSCLLMIAVVLGLAGPAWAGGDDGFSLPGKAFAQGLKASFMYYRSKNSGNSASSAKWRQKAAASGYLEAQVDLCEGLVKADLLSDAEYWCRKGVDVGDAKALFLLSNIFREGYGPMGADDEGAKRALRRSAAKGYRPAIERLTRVEGERVSTEAELNASERTIVVHDYGAIVVFSVLGLIGLYVAYKTVQRALRSKTWRNVVLAQAASIVALVFMGEYVVADEFYMIAGGVCAAFLLADGAVILVADLLGKFRRAGPEVTGATVAATDLTADDAGLASPAVETKADLMATAAHAFSRLRKPAIYLAVGLAVYLGALAMSADAVDSELAADGNPDEFENFVHQVPEAMKALGAYQDGLLSARQYEQLISVMRERGSAKRHAWSDFTKGARNDLYVDQRSVLPVPSDDAIVVWVMYSARGSLKALLRLDCQKRVISQIGYVEYAKPKLDGQRLSDFTFSKGDASRVSKGSILDRLFDTPLCAPA